MQGMSELLRRVSARACAASERKIETVLITRKHDAKLKTCAPAANLTVGKNINDANMLHCGGR